MSDKMLKELDGDVVEVTEFRGPRVKVKVGGYSVQYIPLEEWKALPPWRGALPDWMDIPKASAAPL